MKRRTLLKAAPAASFLAVTPFTVRSSGGSWRTFEVVTRVEIAAPTGQVRIGSIPSGNGLPGTGYVSTYEYTT